MAAPTDATATSSPSPESPTTVKPFEMDDDDVQETSTLDNNPATSTTAPGTAQTSTEEAPTKPPRPLTEQQKHEAMLKEAFPAVDENVIKAVLLASGGRIDPAFNALLGMTDPDAVKNEPAQEAAPPPQPPRPAGRAALSQMEADELYARQLAEHYNNVGAYEARTSNRSSSGHRQSTGLKPDEMYDRERSFFDDDLPEIGENIRQGFIDTQKQVNSWFTNFKKKIDDAYNEEEDESQPSRYQNRGNLGRRSGESSRRSADYDRYDADPQVLSDDLAGMRLNPESRQSSNLHRSTASPKPDGRRVSFKDGTDDIDPYGASPKVPPKDTAVSPPQGKQSKWQPLSTMEPSPITENDPFSLGDSDDERGAIKMEDTERLKQATADAMSDDLVDKKAKEGGSESK